MDRTKGFGIYLDRTLKKIQTAYLKAFETEEIDLTIEQWVILQRIYLLGEDASQSEVVKTNFRNRATTSRVISGLSNKDLVLKERFEGDNKRFKLVLTEKGKSIIFKAQPLIKQLREVAVKEITDDDFDTFLAVLNQIWENYDHFENGTTS